MDCHLLSFVLAGLIALVDSILAVITLGFSFCTISQFAIIKEMLDTHNFTHGGVTWGVLSISLFAILGSISAINQIFDLRRCKIIVFLPWKLLIFLLFLAGEIAGLVFPLLLIKDYDKKVNLLVDVAEEGTAEYVIFNLLLINKVTIGLLIYQILSFCIVFNHNRINRSAEKVVKQGRTEGLDNDKDVEMGQPLMATLEPPICSKPVNKSAPDVKNDAKQPLYPKLDQLLAELPPKYLTTVIPSASKLFSPIVPDDEESGNESSTNKQMHNGESSRFEMVKADLLAKRELFEDHEFPANMDSLGERVQVEWKRPHEINSEAKFFTDGVARFDVKQGELGDCWFLAALANLTLNEALFARVVPSENEWTGSSDYAGVCHFNFFKDGKWQNVIIDDRLPTRNGKLIYMSAADPTEFWSALIEKALAKLYGSYANLDGNDGIGPAMLNLTGGKVERHYVHDFKQDLGKLYELISSALSTGEMVGCCCSNMEDRSLGIVGGHAYSITNCETIELKNGQETACIRIRNPWGNEVEWEGQFSDNHPVWELVDEEMKRDLKLKHDNDGEFWFPLHEVVTHFSHVEICKINAAGD